MMEYKEAEAVNRREGVRKKQQDDEYREAAVTRKWMSEKHKHDTYTDMESDRARKRSLRQSEDVRILEFEKHKLYMKEKWKDTECIRKEADNRHTYHQQTKNSKNTTRGVEKVRQLIHFFRKYADEGCSYVCSVCQQTNFRQYVIKVSSIRDSIQNELLQVSHKLYFN